MGNSKNLKVLICHYGIFKKGGYSRNFNLAKGLVKLGHSVTLLTVSNSIKVGGLPYKEYLIEGVKVLVFYDFLPNFLLRGGFGFISIFAKLLYSSFNRFDIVQSDTGQRPASGLPCLINKLIHRAKYISEWWDYYGKGGHFDRKSKIKKYTIGIFDKIFEKNVRKFADGHVCLSEEMKSRALELNFIDEEITIINGGSDVDNIKFLESSRYKENFGIKDDIITFGFINIEDSEIYDFKNFMLLFENNLLKDKIKCISFGTKLSNKTLTELKIINHIVEIGWIDYEYESIKLSAVDFFVLMKEDNLINRTGWPNKTGDCLASGRQIITNGIGELNKYLEIFPDAFIYCENEINHLQNKVLELIENFDHYLAKRKYCREIAEKFLSWQKKSEDLEKFYIKILGNNN